MKKVTLLLIFVTHFSFGQNFLDKTYDSAGVKHVLIDNFKGDITVVASNSDQIKIVAENSTVNPMKSFQLKEFTKDGVVAVYVDNPCKDVMETFNPDKPFAFIRTANNCDWDGFEEGRMPDLTFYLEVPRNMSVYVSTIMDGDINIDGVEGTVYASNVNGNVSLDNIVNATNGTTVNGDVDVTFSRKPIRSGRFTTINGTINLNVPRNSSLTTKFKSYSGELYTDLEAEMMPRLIKNNETLKSGEYIDIGSYSKAKIGTGEIEFYIETFSGNAYLKKNK